MLHLVDYGQYVEHVLRAYLDGFEPLTQAQFARVVYVVMPRVDTL